MSLDEAPPTSSKSSAFIDRVLVIDSPESAQHVRTLLEAEGHNVTVANEGGQAHATFMLQKPDFVIIELVLPGESGFEICERIKKLNKGVPLMALTAIDLDVSRNLAARVGFDGYLTKPYEDRTLVDMVRDIGDAVWERTHHRRIREIGSIRFTCKCGKRLAMLLKDRGKAMTCPDCHERIDVPEWVGSRRAEFFVPREPAGEAQPATQAQPLDFVTIKCQHCGTYYRLVPGAMKQSRTCPKCHKQQEGPLSIVGAPLSRAALASSRRVLVIRSGKNKGKKLLLPDNLVVIGRSPTCHIRSGSGEVSRRHCLLRTSAEGLMVRDLDSRTGTYINGVRVTEETLLKPSDTLGVGPLRLQLAGTGPPPALSGASSDVLWSKGDENDDESAFVRAKVDTDQFDSTAEEAAKVISVYWETVRRGSAAAEPVGEASAEETKAPPDPNRPSTSGVEPTGNGA